MTRLLPPLNFISSPSCPSDPRERSVKAVDLSGGPVPQAQTSHLSLHNLPSQLHRQFLLQGQHYQQIILATSIIQCKGFEVLAKIARVIPRFVMLGFSLSKAVKPLPEEK